MQDQFNKYQRGNIYTLESEQTDKIYVGSSCQFYLSNRKSHHKALYKKWLLDQDPKKYTSSFEILQYEDCYITLLEEYPCNNKTELREREQYWIDKYKLEYGNDKICNKIRAYTSKEEIKVRKHELYEQNKNNPEYIQKQKEYRDTHKEEKSLTDKIYRENNKDKIKEQKRLAHIQNREHNNERSRNWAQSEHGKEMRRLNRLKNKEKINANNREKITCECGRIVSKNNIAAHRKTSLHKKIMENN